jgi:hypothetical protein
MKEESNELRTNYVIQELFILQNKKRKLTELTLISQRGLYSNAAQNIQGCCKLTYHQVQRIKKSVGCHLHSTHKSNSMMFLEPLNISFIFDAVL